jgi:hypothetical protein
VLYNYRIHVQIIPDGRLNKEKNKILKAVEYLLSTLPRKKSLKHLLGMDNYFTQLVVVAMTSRLNVGLVTRTSRRQRGWPPQEEYKDIVHWRYNTLYKIPCEKDDQKYMLMRWIDNGVVDMVSTVHTGQETIVKRRRKPRETSTNCYRHITTVFGSDWEKI